MARGPKGQYRPEDPVAAAAAVMRIATGESDEKTETIRAIAAAETEVATPKRSNPPKRRPSPDR
jgi:hypothetical protein